MRLSSGQKSFIGGSAKGEILLRSAQSANKAVGIDTIVTICSSSIRSGYNVLEKGNTTSNPTLLNIELMDSATCLNIDVPGGDRLKVFIGWDILSHHRVGAKGFGSPSSKTDHPM